MPTAPHAVIYALLILGLCAGVCWGLRRRRMAAGWTAFGGTAAAALLMVYAALKTLWAAGPPDHAVTYLAFHQYGFALRLYVDGLSAIFVLLIAVIAPASAFYSIAYLRHYPHHDVGRYYPNFLLFLAGMTGLVTTTDAMFFFFIFWQLMTLTSWALIRFERENEACRRAARKYMWLMQSACFITMLGAGLVASGGAHVHGEALARYDFDAISHRLEEILALHPGRVGLGLALFLIGFGIKAGMWPFGKIWLPDAHASAPSPVSAMLSGVMIKTGVYGLLRYFLWLLPPGVLKGAKPFPLTSWGGLLTVLGTATLAIGTAQALRQTQTKRLLAYSSIGQVGYMLLGLGVCLMLLPTPLAGVAALALYGCLFHLLNHGVFKSLLFLNAGTLLTATGTQDLNRLGGLWRPMPWTALCALVGVVSIVGAPLTNGFASKWGLYSAAIQGGVQSWLLPVCALLAILTSGLTLAVFVRFYGAAFLSRTSALVREKLAQATPLEGSPLQLAPKIWLAAWCVVLGLMPFLGVRAIELGLQQSRQGLGIILAEATPLGGHLAGGLMAGEAQAVWTPLALAGTLALMLMLARAISTLGGAARRQAAPWLCGYATQQEAHRYRAEHFFKPLVRWLRSPASAHHPDKPAAPQTD
ncbi:MAG: proton-conducting transporter membrane subunit [Verrucomicrobiae bacterium]|nr:proton-conducting transporter membrane subunit [Verrucomicrobiae bacterium]